MTTVYERQMPYPGKRIMKLRALLEREKERQIREKNGQCGESRAQIYRDLRIWHVPHGLLPDLTDVEITDQVVLEFAQACRREERKTRKANKLRKQEALFNASLIGSENGPSRAPSNSRLRNDEAHPVRNLWRSFIGYIKRKLS